MNAKAAQREPGCSEAEQLRELYRAYGFLVAGIEIGRRSTPGG